MSFSVSAAGHADDNGDKLRERFDATYVNPAPGVEELFNVAVKAVQNFANEVEDDGDFSVSVNGHAHQGDDARSYLSISIQATS